MLLNMGRSSEPTDPSETATFVEDNISGINIAFQSVSPLTSPEIVAAAETSTVTESQTPISAQPPRKRLDGNCPTTVLDALRKARLLFSVSHAGHRRGTRYRHAIGLEPYRILFTIQSFILRGIPRFYPFTSDSSAGHYLKPPNFSLANSQIFWRSYQRLGLELGAQVHPNTSH
jgi:hypothetical protein